MQDRAVTMQSPHCRLEHANIMPLMTAVASAQLQYSYVLLALS
jgi:hypothetical protein